MVDELEGIRVHLPSPLGVAAHKRSEALTLDLTKLVRVCHPPSGEAYPEARDMRPHSVASGLALQALLVAPGLL
jgi:hypothetical protein